jgi:hypothetical protein
LVVVLNIDEVFDEGYLDDWHWFYLVYYTNLDHSNTGNKNKEK